MDSNFAGTGLILSISTEVDEFSKELAIADRNYEVLQDSRTWGNRCRNTFDIWYQAMRMWNATMSHLSTPTWSLKHTIKLDNQSVWEIAQILGGFVASMHAQKTDVMVWCALVCYATGKSLPNMSLSVIWLDYAGGLACDDDRCQLAN